MKKTLYLCRCGSIQHMLVVTADDDDLFFEVHLAPLPFFERVKTALRYVLGGRSRWGDFEEVCLSPAMALELGDRLVEWAGGKPDVFSPNDVY